METEKILLTYMILGEQAENIITSDLNESEIDKILLEHKEEVLLMARPYEDYLFAKYVKGTDIGAHASIVLESKSLICNSIFAEDVKGANVKAHEVVILDSKELFFNLYFARHVEGADVIAHAKAAMSSPSITEEPEVLKSFLELIISKYDFVTKSQKPYEVPKTRTLKP